MKHLLLVVLISQIVPSNQAFAEDRQGCRREMFDLAHELDSLTDTTEREKKILDASESCPGAHQLNYALALEYYNKQMYPEAIKELKSGLIKRNSGEMFYLLGAIQLQLGEKEIAKANFHEALKHPPIASSAAQALAQLYVADGKYREAIQVLIENVPEKDIPETEYINIMLKGGRYGDARDALVKYGKTDTAEYFLALYKTGDYKGIIRNFEQIKNYPDTSPWAYNYTALSFVQLGDIRSATKTYDLMLERFSDFKPGYDNYVQFLEAEGESEKLRKVKDAFANKMQKSK